MTGTKKICYFCFVLLYNTYTYVENKAEISCLLETLTWGRWPG